MARQIGVAIIAFVIGLAFAHAQPSGNVQVSETDAYRRGFGPLYHTSNGIYEILDGLVSVSAFNIVDAATKKSHKAFRVLGRSRPQNNDTESQPTVFIICNQHAREMITGELCMWLVRLLSGDTKTLLEWPEFANKALLTGKGREKIGARLSVPRLRQWINSLTSKFKFEVVPIVNIDGHEYIAETGDFEQRKNMAPVQVDLNRNWAVNRALPGSGAYELDPNDDEYHGRFNLSEWETRSLYNYMNTKLAEDQRAMFIDVHSGMWAIMSPWGGKFNMSDLPGSFIASQQALFDVMQPAFMDPRSQPPNNQGIACGPGSGMLYASQGSSDDTAYKALGFSRVLTLEVYGPKGLWDSGWSFDCPSLQEFQATCSDDSRMCGDTVCQNSATGELMHPTEGKRRDAVSAAYMSAQTQQPRIHSAQPNSAQLSTARAGTTAQVLFQNQDLDPFMKLWPDVSANSITYFKYFNPHTPQLYREVVSRWLAGMLFAFEELSNQMKR